MRILWKDDFVIEENAEGVDEEIVHAIVASKKKELDAKEAFEIFDVCEELPKDAKRDHLFPKTLSCGHPFRRAPAPFRPCNILPTLQQSGKCPFPVAFVWSSAIC